MQQQQPGGSMLELIAACDKAPYPERDLQTYRGFVAGYYDFMIHGYQQPVGAVPVKVVEAFPWPATGWVIDHDRKTVTLQTPADATVSQRSDVLAAALQAAKAARSFPELGGWRGELYAIYGPDRQLLANIERAAAGLFGIATFGVHINAYVRREDHAMQMWVPRRSPTKQTWPGMLDNSVAGGLASGEAPLECAVREAAEEASLPSELVRGRIRACGAISYLYVCDGDGQDRGTAGALQPETQYIYDLELPPTTVLKPGDAEVAAFQLMTLEDVVAALVRREFKPNCAVVLVDFLIRHGYITAENEPDHLEIIARCRYHQHRPHGHGGLDTARRGVRRFATPVDPARQKEYAFEMAASSIRFGPGVTREVGMDLKNMGVKRVCVVTDPIVAGLAAMEQAVTALEREGIQYTVYDKTRCEPKDYSVKDAISFSKAYGPDSFLAVGGGSVIDTAKMMNLYTVYKDADFLDFVNAPLGKGLPITKKMLPLIAVPTTAGTGSETTGTAIFDFVEKQAKTGIAHRNLKPTLGICDPLNTRTMPSAVHASSGLDVLCHSLESWTAIPYNERTPRPTNPIARPAYQGANPISDIFSLQALRSTAKYLPRAVRDPDDHEAQEQMLLSATLAGVGFGNAGVHLCHGMSYPISGQNPGYKHAGYQVDHPIVPHGVSVAITAPAVFRFTGPSNPERHLAAAEAFGVDITTVKRESAGEVLAEAIAKFLVELGDQPRGLKALGFRESQVDELIEGTIPQQRVLGLAPNLARELDQEREELRRIFLESMEY
ncbi:hypothetical protein KEM52_004237 [Ascosphaera acerosa]|nr:hypothetical protein KEM52_004237 [Ascosphaera acerosa]